jgi:xanthine dehydrogenase accessory factor
MDSLDHQVLDRLLSWHAQGQRFWLVTLTRTWGSAPREAGSWLGLCAQGSGELVGGVSGGCIEDDLIERVRMGEWGSTSLPFVLRYGESADEARRFGLPCGGALELVVEPAPSVVLLAELAQRIGRGECVSRSLDLRSGEVTLCASRLGQSMQWDGEQLHTQHGPRRRLLIIGAGPIARVLALTAPALDFAVSVCDPREEVASGWDVASAPLIPGMPDDVVQGFAPDAHSAIVALTHDPKLDDLALIDALRTPAFYVGALGSVRSNAARRARLAEHFGLTALELDRLHGPVGLAIGARTPAEIAVAILAGLVAQWRGAAM